MSLCPAPSPDLGVVRSVLSTVDCHVQVYSEAGYGALTGPHSVFPLALTALLTIYVALLGYRLMFGLGGARLAEAPIIALKIGVILALTLNWTTFQTLVFDVAMKAPLDVAKVVGAPATASGSALAADPLGGLQVAYDQLALDAAAFGKIAGPNPQILRGGEAAAADGLWKAQAALFMSTAGLMAISLIAVGVLSALGPLFIALFLFDATRGLFAGWVRALTAAALAPLVCWITTTVLLVVIDPWLVQLARAREAGAPDVQTAATVSAVVFIFAAAQAALAVGATMIAGGFQLNFQPRDARSPSPTATAPSAAPILSRADRLAHDLRRSGVIAASASVQTRAGSAAPVSFTPSSGVVAGASPRLGDSYRRDAFMDRFRQPRRSLR
jgi:type IV secretion system protein VirB6